jgi:glycogen operon protein
LDTKVKPADAGKLGATLVEGGTNFALWAPAAEAVELCLFNRNQLGQLTETRFALTHREGPIWHGFLAGVTSGQLYGFRVYGTWDPARGLRFNPAKVLIDPYANLISGELKNAPEIFGHQAVDEFGNGDLDKEDLRDSAPYVPFSVVTEITKSQINRPRIPWNKTIIYEAHVKGLTFRNLEIPESDRGTYRALSHPTVIAHLQKLGVTTLELLPIHHHLTETSVRSRGRINHWGYNPIAFSAPHGAYGATDDPIRELQEAISILHEAGIEVVLDVVYNHTAEEGKAGPTLSFRGIDNKAFYRHIGDDEYEDVTGCGNTLDTRNPFVTRMILDSLRWWAEVIGVDGFRFDLTTALSRLNGAIDTNSSLISAITADPILRELKLIAEPWDVKGYALGDFPHPWREWNDAYRDAVRQFWLADSAQGFSAGVSDLASRIAGSDDVFYYRGPTSSINFITAHDGFTLTDLVSYQDKHNQPNGEDNREFRDRIN